jgi:hypothetical protein
MLVVLRGAFLLAAIGLGLVDVIVAAVMLATIGAVVGVVAAFVGLVVTIVSPVIIALVVPGAPRGWPDTVLLAARCATALFFALA